RAAAPGLPIALALDSHGSVTPEMTAHCNVIVGYQTFPHLDMVETGYRAGMLLMQSLKTGVTHSVVSARTLILTSILKQNTNETPMSELLAMARRAECQNIPSVRLCAGFAWSGAPQTGFSVAAVTTSDNASAGQKICEDICD